MINFLRNLGFTKQDFTLAGFLIILLITGLVLRFAGLNKVGQFNYSGNDGEVEKQIKAGFSELHKVQPNEMHDGKLQSLIQYRDNLENLSEQTSPNKKTFSLHKKININTAYSSDLQALPGIGVITAEKIIAYREASNGFKKIEEIMNVKGIGRKKFEKMKDFISVE
ncbi:MAG: ComEA family DNA-binding protein [Ignavibacteria bacterium]